ncbi:MAG: ectoine hydroxylase [Gammaproteobacteria bacterium]|nr:ectoine hydroxylase [Gammaproteobacteria bacterium]
MNSNTATPLYSPDPYPSRVAPRPARLDRLDPVIWGAAGKGPLDKQALARYERQGYLIMPALLDADEVAGFSAELSRLRHDFAASGDARVIAEPGSGAVRSIFAVHELSERLTALFRDPRLLGAARQILGGDVYLHQSRINYKPGFRGKEFYWHSDFETWHVEDGMPRMRALSCSISLTDNTENNGPLLLIPGSHLSFIACVGETPQNHYQTSLRRQEYGVPDDLNLADLVREGGIEAFTGIAGSVVFFDCNTMHGSSSNISPQPRSNIFAVYNSVENTLGEPTCGLPPRPQFIADRRPPTPLRPPQE